MYSRSTIGRRQGAVTISKLLPIMIAVSIIIVTGLLFYLAINSQPRQDGVPFRPQPTTVPNLIESTTAPQLVPGETRTVPPELAGAAFEQLINDFYTGTAALQVKFDQVAAPRLQAAFERYPQEPAIAFNYALFFLHTNNEAKAMPLLRQAAERAPLNTRIQFTLGLALEKQGDLKAAQAQYEKVLTIDPQAITALYALTGGTKVQGVLIRLGKPETDPQRLQYLNQLLSLRPRNLLLQLEMVRVQLLQQDYTAAQQLLKPLIERRDYWPAQAQELLDRLQRSLEEQSKNESIRALIFVANILSQTVEYQLAQEELLPSSATGLALNRFLQLPNRPAAPAAPDLQLAYKKVSLLPPNAGTGSQPKPTVTPVATVAWSIRDGRYLPTVPDIPGVSDIPDNTLTLAAVGEQIVSLTPAGQEAIGLSIPFPAATNSEAHLPNSLLFFDWNYDFTLDLLAAGPNGLRVYQQQPAIVVPPATATPATTSANQNQANSLPPLTGWDDVTASWQLTDEVRHGAFWGAWPVDIEADGDLDVLVAAMAGPTIVLRNNGDGTFRPLDTFAKVVALRGCAWADVDADGDLDAMLLDSAGLLHPFRNERNGKYRRRPGPTPLPLATAITVADLTGDGRLDYIIAGNDGSILAIADGTDERRQEQWQVMPVLRPPNSAIPADGPVANELLFVADLDNNGGLDVVWSHRTQTSIYLRNAQLPALDQLASSWQAGPTIDGTVLQVADVDGNGWLDLLGTTAGQAMLWQHAGQQDYRWVQLQPLAKNTLDRKSNERINTFGIGGEMSVCAGRLVNKQPITGPLLHFGLGQNESAQVARILWPSGLPQAEFDLPSRTVIQASQRLNAASCPYLFTFNGSEWVYVTDLIWRCPLGVRLAENLLATPYPLDWVRIDGSQLQAVDGAYRLRVTAELWETHYFDYFALLVVDHPADQAVYVDERYAPEPPPLAVSATTIPVPVTAACDETGNSVQETIAVLDRTFHGDFTTGLNSGVTADHWVEFTVPDLQSDPTGPIVLVANGWLRPTDSSINLALSQSSFRPIGMVLEALAATGQWQTIDDQLGFPAGRIKTVLLDLDRALASSPSRRLRLRSNMEIHWDYLGVACRLPNSSLQIQKIEPSAVTLQERGFSLFTRANNRSPELPIYDEILARGQIWRDLVGFYTRPGSVTELTAQTDDRYAILNAGDELALTFPAVATATDEAAESTRAAPMSGSAASKLSGWQRTYVLIADGWVKDGNLNTAASQTVLPLPYHDQGTYPTEPGTLHQDPLYLRYPQDWLDYHTRFIRPRDFNGGIQPSLTSD